MSAIQRAEQIWLENLKVKTPLLYEHIMAETMEPIVLSQNEEPGFFSKAWDAVKSFGKEAIDYGISREQAKAEAKRAAEEARLAIETIETQTRLEEKRLEEMLKQEELRQNQQRVAELQRARDLARTEQRDLEAAKNIFSDKNTLLIVGGGLAVLLLVSAAAWRR